MMQLSLRQQHRQQMQMHQRNVESCYSRRERPLRTGTTVSSAFCASVMGADLDSWIPAATAASCNGGHQSRSSSSGGGSWVSFHCDGMLAHLILCITVACFVVVGITNYSCTYIGGGRGAMCVRPGHVVPYGKSPEAYGVASLHTDAGTLRDAKGTTKAGSMNLGGPAASNGKSGEGAGGAGEAAVLFPSEAMRRAQATLEDRINAQVLAAIAEEEKDMARSWMVKKPTPPPPRVKVRFATASNQTSLQLCNAIGSAALSGVRMPVLGFQQPYSHLTRFRAYLAFAEAEGLGPQDIIVLADSDGVWTGEDVSLFLSKFALRSAASEAELDVAAVRAWEDYGHRIAPAFLERFVPSSLSASNTTAQCSGALLDDEVVEGKGQQQQQGRRRPYQLPPLFFNTELYCMRRHAALGEPLCESDYNVLEIMLEAVRNQHTMSLEELRKHTSDPKVTKLLQQLDVVIAAKGGTTASRKDAGAAARSGSVFNFFDDRYRSRTHGRRYGDGGDGDADVEDSNTPRYAKAASAHLSHCPRGEKNEKRADIAEQETELLRTCAAGAEDSSDDFCFHGNTHGKSSAFRFLNAGGIVARVWALRFLADALEAYVAEHDTADDQVWFCDQSALATMYLHTRMWEAEEGLLYAPPLPVMEHVNVADVSRAHGDDRAEEREDEDDDDNRGTVAGKKRRGEGRRSLVDASTTTTTNNNNSSQNKKNCLARELARRTNPLGLPAGLMGIDRRSEFFYVSTDAVKNKHFTMTSYLRSPSSYCANCRMAGGSGGLQRLRQNRLSGAVLTPPLLLRPPSSEDKLRRLCVCNESARDVVTPAFIHHAGSWKEMKYVSTRYYLPWFVASRLDRGARRVNECLLAKTQVEVWEGDERRYYDYLKMCGNPFIFH